MDESQTDTPASEREDQGGSRGITIGLALLVVYFLCPFVYLIPLYLLYAKSSSPPPWIDKAVDGFFVPIVFLCDLIPLYESLIDTEMEIVSRVFFP